jgi:hypothetical protein
MKKIFGIISFKDEARLLDSRIYIIKAALTVLAAYSAAALNPVLKLDTISVLFGAMMTLEPVTLTGIKSGWNQLSASLIGGTSTAVIMLVFGINAVTVALAVAFTLYICLKINWREVSPVAIFTAIYMTQYIQRNGLGEPSILLTLRLRLLALGFGILTSAVFNFLFAVLSYKSLAIKRIYFLMASVISNMESIEVAIAENVTEDLSGIRASIPSLFNTIDWVFYMFEDMKREHRFKLGALNTKLDIDKLQNIILHIRTITHLNYDICYAILEGKDKMEPERECKNKILKGLAEATKYMKEVKFLILNEENFIKAGFLKESFNSNKAGRESCKIDGYNRVEADIVEIEDNIIKILNEVEYLKK